MNRDNRILKWMVWVVAATFFAPGLYEVLFLDFIGVIPNLVNDRTDLKWPWYFLISGYLISVLLFLKRFRLTDAAFIFALLVYVQIFCATSLSTSRRIVQVAFGNREQDVGVNVYCNGIHLGTTPLVISETDFHQKVKPWTQPPEQPAVIHSGFEDSFTVNGYQNSAWTWTPDNPFELPSDPFERIGRFSRFKDLQGITQFLKSSKYWWRFEKEDLLTLRMMNPLSIDQGIGSKVITRQAGLSLHAPAVGEMFRLLLQGLRLTDYQASKEWSEFVLKGRDQLLATLILEAKSDAKLANVLDQVAYANFHWTETDDRASSNRILERVFESLTAMEEDAVNWMARRTALAIVHKYPELLVEKIQTEARPAPREWLSGMIGPARFRRTLLLELLAEIGTNELFGFTVYLCGLVSSGGDGIDIFVVPNDPLKDLMISIGKHNSPEARRLVSRYVQNVWYPRTPNPFHGSPFNGNQLQMSSVEVMSRIDQPELEDTFWNLIGREISPNFANDFTPLISFVESRIKRNANLGRLVQRIDFCACFTSEQKARFLVQINHPDARESLLRVTDQMDDNQRYQLVMKMSDMKPNPSTDEFLIESWEQWKESQRGWLDQLRSKILRLDTPAIRGFISDELANAEDADMRDGPGRIFRCTYSQFTERFPALNWIVPKLGECKAGMNQPSSSLLEQALCEFLREIGTDEANALLREWAEDSQLTNGLKNTAKNALDSEKDQLESENAKNAELLEKMNDLISGRIRPDDLVSPLPSAHWNGETYDLIPAKKSL